jgi:thiol-disulfide isomerase/thioredoxin
MKVSSTRKELGFAAPDFELWEPLTNRQLKLSELKSDKATVVMFLCNHCPYVQHIFNSIVKLADEYIPSGISFIGINSNDPVSHASDSPVMMIEEVKKRHIGFPYLFDESQDVARDYDAACTPEFNIFDSMMRCVYRGQFDDSRPGNNIPVTGNDIRMALDALLENRPVNKEQRQSVGCSIKWKKR